MKKYARKTLTLLFMLVCLLVIFQNGNLKAEARDNINLERKKIKTVSVEETRFMDQYHSSAPGVTSFFDYKGNYNVACMNNKTLYIYRYNKNMKLSSTLKIKRVMKFFGNITCDDKGNYYVCWGTADNDYKNTNVINITKYNYSGKKLVSKSFKGYDLTPYKQGDYWGTRIAFDGGTCKMAVNKGVLACNFAREMYSGHQSNMVFYLDCNTLQRKTGYVPYCSHSFDQACIATSDGGFLMADHGDAYSRGFMVSKIKSNIASGGKVFSFHFREARYNYNETYAQLGGVAETSKAYVLCGSSERTLSLAPKGYDDESRDLFVQIFKKDFTSRSGADMYYAKGAIRTATGKKPQDSNYELWLKGNEKNYGVIWVTNYKNKYFAANPKVVALGGKIIVLWEKHSMSGEFLGSYYAVLSEGGAVLKKAEKIGNSTLPYNADVVRKGNKLYWVTNTYYDDYETYINILDISDINEKEHKYETVVTKATLKKNGKLQKKCSECGKVVKTKTIYRPKTIRLEESVVSYTGEKASPEVVVKDSKGKVLERNVDYTVKYPSERTEMGKYKLTVKFKGDYSGKKTLSFTVGVKEIGLSAERSSGQSAVIHLDVPWNTDSMEIQYSKYKDFPEGNTDSSTYYGGYSFWLTINGLEPGAKYYVRARACQVVDGKEYYSKYSTCTIKAE